MFSNHEKFSSASKTFLESQFANFNALASKTLEGGEKLIALNIAAVKTSAEEFHDAARQLLTLQDPQAIFALVAERAKPNVEKAASYGRHLTEILSSIHADLTKAVDAQIAGTTSKVTALVDQVAKSAPAGSEHAVAMLKSVTAMQMPRTSQQAVDQIEAHVAKATDQVSQIIDKPVAKAASK
jgi:phasin family protein